MKIFFEFFVCMCCIENIFVLFIFFFFICLKLDLNILKDFVLSFFFWNFKLKVYVIKF